MVADCLVALAVGCKAGLQIVRFVSVVINSRLWPYGWRADWSLAGSLLFCRVGCLVVGRRHRIGWLLVWFMAGRLVRLFDICQVDKQSFFSSMVKMVGLPVDFCWLLSTGTSYHSKSRTYSGLSETDTLYTAKCTRMKRTAEYAEGV